MLDLPNIAQPPPPLYHPPHPGRPSGKMTRRPAARRLSRSETRSTVSSSWLTTTMARSTDPPELSTDAISDTAGGRRQKNKTAVKTGSFHPRTLSNKRDECCCQAHPTHPRY